MNKNLKTLFSLTLYFIFICGIALVALSYLPLNKIKFFFDYLTPDGNFQSFSFKHAYIPRFYGILSCIVSGYVYIHRRQFLQYFSNICNFLKKPEIFINFIKNFKGHVKAGFLIKPHAILSLIISFMKNFMDAAKKEDRIHSYTFILIILMAIAVRIYYMFQPLRVDESLIFTMFIYDVQGVKGLTQLFTNHYSGMHTFYTILSYLTYKFLGSEQQIWVIRMPALFAGILMVPASYMVIQYFYNKKAALLTAGMVASSSAFIFHSTNARGYTLLFLFFLLIFALGTYLKDNNNLTGWHLFSILSALGFYTMTIFVLPYGVVIIWIILSIIDKDTTLNRNDLLRNLFFSVAITVLLVFLLYFPKLFIGAGPESLHMKELHYQAQNWVKFFFQMPISITTTLTKYGLQYWFETTPFIIYFLALTGFFISLVFHNKLSTPRVPVILAVFIWLPLVFLGSKLHTAMPRYFVFLLPLCIGMASSGVVFLFNPLERIFNKYWPAIFATLVIISSFWLIANKISEPYLTDGNQPPRYDIAGQAPQMQNFDKSGRYVEFEYIMTSMKQHFRHDPSNKKVLFIFPSSTETDFWITRMDKYCGKIYCKSIFIYDLNSYLSKDSRTCHRLFVFSSQVGTNLEILLEKKGLSVSDYNNPQLMHRFISVNLYKMDRITDCELK